MIRQLLFISSLLVSSIVCAIDKDEWIQVASSASYVKLLSAKRMTVLNQNDQIVELWIKTKYSNPPKNSIFKVGDITLAKQRFDCINMKTQDQKVVLYRTDQVPITEDAADVSWYELPPESVGENLLNQVCGLKFSKATI